MLKSQVFEFIRTQLLPRPDWRRKLGKHYQIDGRLDLYRSADWNMWQKFRFSSFRDYLDKWGDPGDYRTAKKVFATQVPHYGSWPRDRCSYVSRDIQLFDTIITVITDSSDKEAVFAGALKSVREPGDG